LFILLFENFNETALRTARECGLHVRTPFLYGDSQHTAAGRIFNEKML